MGPEGNSVGEMGRLGKSAGSRRILIKDWEEEVVDEVEGRERMKRREKKEVARIM